MLFFAGLLFFSFLIRIWLAAFGGIHPDEAYYWLWSEYPSLGYFDHPPMVAWLIKLSRVIVGNLIPDRLRDSSPLFFTMIEFRFIPYLFSAFITPLLIGKCVQKIQRKPLNLSQMIVIMTAPIFLFGPQVITPDTPFFAAWCLCLYASIKFLQSRKSGAFPGDPTPLNVRNAVFAGLALAFAGYSKYTALLAAFLIVIAGAGVSNSLILALVSFVLVLPYFIWNMGPGKELGAGLFFQMQNATGNIWSHNNYKRVGDLWLTQLLFWNPILFLSCFGIFFSDLRRFFGAHKKSVFTGTLLLWSFVPLFFFSLSGLKRTAEGNWPLVGLIPAMALVLSRYQKNFLFLSVLMLTNVATSICAVLMLTRNHQVADWVEPYSTRLARELRKPSRLHEFQDWESFHTLVFEATRSEAQLPIEVHTYQTLSELVFFDHVAAPNERFGTRLKIWGGGSRPSQFHILPNFNLKEPKGSRWLLARNDEKVPGECRFSQNISKGIADPKPFAVYKCSFGSTPAF